jgi:hypothetical protein
MFLLFWMDTHWSLCRFMDDCSCLSGSIPRKKGKQTILMVPWWGWGSIFWHFGSQDPNRQLCWFGNPWDWCYGDANHDESTTRCIIIQRATFLGSSTLITRFEPCTYVQVQMCAIWNPEHWSRLCTKIEVSSHQHTIWKRQVPMRFINILFAYSPDPGFPNFGTVAYASRSRRLAVAEII